MKCKAALSSVIDMRITHNLSVIKRSDCAELRILETRAASEQPLYGSHTRAIRDQFSKMTHIQR
jgi:hypothetical protein